MKFEYSDAAATAAVIHNHADAHFATMDVDSARDHHRGHRLHFHGENCELSGGAQAAAGGSGETASFRSSARTCEARTPTHAGRAGCGHSATSPAIACLAGNSVAAVPREAEKMKTEFRKAVLPQELRSLMVFDRKVFSDADIFPALYW